MLSLGNFSWADAVESAVGADMAAALPPLAASRGGRAPAPKAKELDMLAETSRDGINLLFKNVMKMPLAPMEEVRAGGRPGPGAAPSGEGRAPHQPPPCLSRARPPPPRRRTRTPRRATCPRRV